MEFESIMVNEGNFRSYDVRGEYPVEIDASTAYAIAKAYAQYNPAKLVVVGYDHRSSTPALKEALVQGLLDAGINVWDIGQVTTDMTYFSSWYYHETGHNPSGVEGAVMITASHMPARFNGIKFITKELKPIGKGSGMEELYDLAKDVKITKSVDQRGSVITKDVMADYVNYLYSFIDQEKLKPLKVVMDCGNGVAGPIINEVFDSLGLQITKMFFEPDSTFPNHEANPILPENRIDIEKQVKEEKADLGIAWDADADRAYFIDEKGDYVHGDFITALLAIQFLKNNPGAGIVYDLRASNVVPDTVQKFGGVAYKEKVGHAHIKKTMREKKAVFGGEVSGHYYFARNEYMDNGIIPALLVLELLSESGKTLSQFIGELGKYYVSGEINSTVKDQDAVINALQKKYADARQDFIDGISIVYTDWKCNVRPSANDPVIRLNLEANSRELMEQKRDEVLTIIRSY